MGEIIRQVKRQKGKVMVFSLCILVGSGFIFFLLLYRDAQSGPSSMDGVHPSIFGIGFCAAVLLLIALVLALHELSDDHKQVLRGLPKTQLEGLEKQVCGIDLFAAVITVTDALVILNANGYTLKLIPICDLTRAKMEHHSGFRRNPPFSVLHLHTREGKRFRSSALPEGSKGHENACRAVEQLNRIVKRGRARPSRTEQRSCYCASYESLSPGYEEVYRPLLTLAYGGASQEALVLARFLDGTTGQQTLDQAIKEAREFSMSALGGGREILARRYQVEGESSAETMQMARLVKELVRCGATVWDIAGEPAGQQCE